MGKENKEEKTEKKSSKYVWWLTIVVIVLLIAFFGFGYAVGSSKLAKEVNENLDNNKPTENLEVTDTVKTKLGTFVNVGSYYDTSGANETLTYFMKGTTSLDKKIKLRMTRNYIYKDGRVTRDVYLSEEDINNLTGVKPTYNEPIDSIKKAEYDKTYKELFDEDANYTFDEIKEIGCPIPLAMNKETQTIYFFQRCGGDSTTTYETSITSYDSDTDYYYVHEDVKYINRATGETSLTKVLWKFTKDLKFESTTVE